MIFLLYKYRQTPRSVQFFPDGIEMSFKYGRTSFIPYNKLMDMCPADVETNWVAGLRIEKNKNPFFIDKEIADAINERFMIEFGEPIPYWDGIGRGLI